MFRECFFEYAGQSSRPYNLMLAYVGNAIDSFDSGGGFDLKTDVLPRSRELLLYGKDYSAKPLEFEVEFLNLHGSIPLEQMTEIKDWLFEQDGWKTFKCLDERQDYHLKCIFEPGEDIVDSSGYRGLRCTLRNVSPFWYAEPLTISFSASYIASIANQGVTNAKRIEVPVPLSYNNDAVFPIINISVDTSSYPSSLEQDPRIIILNSTRDSTPVPQLTLSNSHLRNPYTDDYTINTRHRLVYSDRQDAYLPFNASDRLFFRLYEGTNQIDIVKNDTVSIGIDFTFSVPVRMGAF